MDLLGSKLLCLGITLLLTLIFGLLPIRLVRHLEKATNHRSRLTRLLGYMNCFGGGVFFGAFLIHMLPESREELLCAMKKWTIHVDFPLTEFVVGMGFFMVLIVEFLVASCMSSESRGYTNIPRDDSSSCNSSALETGYHNAAAEPHTEEPSHSAEFLNTSTVRALILIFALSLHSIFAGLAVGLQHTVDDVMTIFLAVDCHKFIVAFSLGLEVAQASTVTTKRFLLYMIAFSVMTPIGITVGIFVSDTDSGSLARNTASSLLQALATGTFLYVTFMEVLQKELEHGKSALKLLFVAFGFALMVGAKFLDKG